MNLATIEEAIALAQARWPGFEFKAYSRDGASGPCPFENQGEDRFVLSIRGHYWCRQCSIQGWLDEGEKHTWSYEEIRLRRLEAEQLTLKRKQADQERRLKALEHMAHCQDHITYFNNLDEDSFRWWKAQGMWDETILNRKMGYCPQCPTDRGHRPSYTLPIWDRHGKVLWNIRHRLKSEDGDKYRPHIAGLGHQLANAQVLNDASYTLILEGAKKAVAVSQYGFPAVGVMGCNGVFKGRWLSWLPKGPVYVALDPDAQDSAEKLARGLSHVGLDARIATPPMKPDDMFLNGGTVDDFTHVLNLARRVR